MARSRLSVHAIPEHDPQSVLNYIAALQPPLILIVNPDPDFVSRAYQASPNSLFSLRNHPLSEQKNDMMADPAGTGQRHAREMVEWCDRLYAEADRRRLPMPPLENVILPGINEPLVNEDHQITACVTYNVNYLDGLTARKRRGSCLEFSVGWPRNSGPDQPPQWEPWRPVYEACVRGGHIPSLHEYWPKEGPSYWAGWLCYRAALWLPDYWRDLPFIFTEVGLDDAAAPGRPHGFWKDFFMQNPQAYVNQYREYEWNNRSMKSRSGKHLNVLGYAIFTSDYGGNEWENADLKEITHLFLQMVNSVDFPNPAPGHTLHLPALGKGHNIAQPVPPTEPTRPPAPKPEPLEPPNNLGEWVIESMSRILGFNADLANAVLRVESGKRPFANGRPVIRLEAHIMRDNMANKALFDRHFQYSQTRRWENQKWRRNENDSWQDIHTNQDNEWKVFEFAKTLDSRAAHLALGMGAGQVMGFNYRVPRYDSPEQMLQAFADPQWGAANQISAMFAYIYQTDGLVEAMRVGDLATIALKYNGPGQIDHYVRRFQEELNALRG